MNKRKHSYSNISNQNSIKRKTNINFNKYSLSELVSSKIHFNYSNSLELNNHNIDYLIKHKLFAPEYITELCFNIRNDIAEPIEPFGRIGIYDLLQNKTSYEVYSSDTKFNVNWKATNGNALVGFEIYYNKNIQKIRFIEAPIDNEHYMIDSKPHNSVFSKWYGNLNKITSNNKNDGDCNHCGIPNDKYQLIYMNNMYISGFKLKYAKSIITFDNVYFKVGIPILKNKLDKVKCCTYSNDSVEYLCCNMLKELNKCSVKDLQATIKDNLTKCIKANLRNINTKYNINTLIKENINNITSKIFESDKSKTSSTKVFGNLHKSIDSNSVSLGRKVKNIVSPKTIIHIIKKTENNSPISSKITSSVLKLSLSPSTKTKVIIANKKSKPLSNSVVKKIIKNIKQRTNKQSNNSLKSSNSTNSIISSPNKLNKLLGGSDEYISQKSSKLINKLNLSKETKNKVIDALNKSNSTNPIRSLSKQLNKLLIGSDEYISQKSSKLINKLNLSKETKNKVIDALNKSKQLSSIKPYNKNNNNARPLSDNLKRILTDVKTENKELKRIVDQLDTYDIEHFNEDTCDETSYDLSLQYIIILILLLTTYLLYEHSKIN